MRRLSRNRAIGEKPEARVFGAQQTLEGAGVEASEIGAARNPEIAIATKTSVQKPPAPAFISPSTRRSLRGMVAREGRLSSPARIALAVALLWCVAPGAAAEPKKPAAPPPHGLVIDKPGAWRLVTPYSTTSDCLGDPKTALCAVETAIGCYLRNDPKLCRVIGREPVVRRDGSLLAPSLIFWRYRVVGYRRIREDRHSDYGRDKAHELVNDLRVYVAVQACLGSVEGYDLCVGYRPIPGATNTFLVRRTDLGWNVIASIGMRIAN